MAKRRSKAKEQEEMIKGALGLIVVVVGMGSYYLTKSTKVAIIATALGIGIFIAFMIHAAIKREERLKRSGIRDVDKMDGIQFEEYLGHLFRSQGYRVKVTRASGDYGADLVLEKANFRIVVQSKRYSKNVGLKAIQEIQAAKAYYDASEAWVISNRDYTDAAIALAKSNRVRLIDRSELIEMMLTMNKPRPAIATGGQPITPQQVIVANPTVEKVCPRCGSKMVMRKGPKGEFYGCSGFPKCRYTLQMEVTGKAVMQK